MKAIIYLDISTPIAPTRTPSKAELYKTPKEKLKVSTCLFIQMQELFSGMQQRSKISILYPQWI
jgi:hypothetical protein